MTGTITIALATTLRINDIYETMDHLVDKAEDISLQQTGLRDVLRQRACLIIGVKGEMGLRIEKILKITMFDFLKLVLLYYLDGTKLQRS